MDLKMGAGKSLMLLNTSRFSDEDESTSAIDIKAAFVPPSKPTPLQFELFIPWVCFQWCASTTVAVKRHYQEDYIKLDTKKLSPKVSRKGKRKTITEETQTFIESDTVSPSFVDKDGFTHSRPMPIQAYYNNKNQLVEVAFLKCPKFSRKVIHAISLCIPYHYTLNRLSVRRGGLTDELIYEINKLIPLSNITEICFDDSYVREANYYILLEDYSQLKYLSLNRCSINDAACKKIVMNIDFGTGGSKSLQILELGSNLLTDSTAKLFGLVLKKNRCLLHLNLSGNQITDEGFKAIMNSLILFPLTYDEVVELKKRRLRYLKNKTAVYQRCLRELIRAGHDDAESSTSSKRMTITARRLRRKSRKHTDDAWNITGQAEAMARGIVGEFQDPYNPKSVVIENGYRFCKGNMILCSLNMAYNSLEFPSVKKLNEVVAYQFVQEKLPSQTGLMRITLDGNNIPSICSELDDINGYLKKDLDCKTPLFKRGRTSSLRKILTTRSQVINTNF